MVVPLSLSLPLLLPLLVRGCRCCYCYAATHGLLFCWQPSESRRGLSADVCVWNVCCLQLGVRHPRP
jgi:hypothetical protein